MKIFGLKLARYRQWLRVVRDEGRRVGLRALVASIAETLRHGTVSRATWQTRMRDCARCPVYDRPRRTCRRGNLGCGCYMPLKAAFKGPQCWGRRFVPNGPFGHRE